MTESLPNPLQVNREAEGAKEPASHPSAFGAADVVRLRDWLGVRGADITEETWQGMSEKTQRLYVHDLIDLTRGGIDGR
jgi:hypothetical protein